MPGGGLADELFADYRPVDGIKVAFKASVRRNNVVVIERAVTSFGINTPLQPGLFDPPGSPAAKQVPPPAPPPTAPTPSSAPTAAAPARPPSPTGAARTDAPAPRPSVAPVDVAPLAATSLTPRTEPADKTARALIDKAIAARGGLERLKAVKTMRIEADSTEMFGNNKRGFSTTSYIQYPDKYRVETRGWGQSFAVRLSGTVLEQRTPTGHEIFDAAGKRSVEPGAVLDPIYDSESRAYLTFKASVERDPIVLLPRIASGAAQAHLFGPVVPPGSAGEQLVEITTAETVPVVLGIDTVSGEITRASYPITAGSTEPWVDERFSDYRDVDGIKIPFRSSITQMNTPIRERRLKQVQINLALDPQLFERLQ